MPTFSHLFGLHPWDVERLTWNQFEMYREWAKDWNTKQGAT